MSCGFIRRVALAGSLAAAAAAWAAGPIVLRLPNSDAVVQIDRHSGRILAIRAGSLLIGQCADEYRLLSEDEKPLRAASEERDRVLRLSRRGGRVEIWCRCELGVRIRKVYELGPLAGMLRKTVEIERAPAGGMFEVRQRVFLAPGLRQQALLYTPRQSWLGPRLLYGVRKLADVREAIVSGSGWDNRFVVAFGLPHGIALAHWRSRVDGQWVPFSGVIAPWGRTSRCALTYYTDGWSFRLLHAMPGERTSAAADIAVFRGDWYTAWRLYRTLPGRISAYKYLEGQPEWCRHVVFGGLTHEIGAATIPAAAHKLAKKLGPKAVVTVGIFAWSLDGDYETERPFMTETLRFVLTPQFLAKWVSEVQSDGHCKLGLYIQGGLIDSLSECFRRHPDWVIRGSDGKPVYSGFADNPVGFLYQANPRVEAWLRHHCRRIEAVLRRYGNAWIYLDGGGYGEAVDFARGQSINFAHCRHRNEAVLATVRRVGPDRALLINCQNAPFCDMTWLECGYFGSTVPWRDTVEFCFDTECAQDERVVIEPLYWADNWRYLAMCVAFGWVPVGDLGPDKDPAVWRAIWAAHALKRAKLVLNSAATWPVWWRDEVPVVTFACRLGGGLVVPILNFGETDKVKVKVNLQACGISEKNLRAWAYQPLVSERRRELGAVSGGVFSCELEMEPGFRSLTLLIIGRKPLI